jgi:hydrogenase maturation protein HypF
MEKIAVRIQINGIVQGVGFRPFVYNAAHKYCIKGHVLNDSHGVEINAYGEKNDIENFIFELKNNPPKLSLITSCNIENLPVTSAPVPNSFTIKDSVSHLDKTALISPDVTTCNICSEELFDIRDRRYYYPFINCTNCGPRYTIIENIPYDRKYTSMKEFPMCPECEEEYNNPINRRFHAQPNACFICGPQLFLSDSQGKVLLNAISLKNNLSKSDLIRYRREKTEEIIEAVISFLKDGKIVAIKGIGGFHLAVNAKNDTAVLKLRERKNRYEKPLAVMSSNIEKILSYAYVSSEDELLLNSIQKPIVLLKKRADNSLSKSIAAYSDCFGVMLPYAPIHQLLLRNEFIALIMTSGNFSEEPICMDNNEAIERLNNIADYFLLHNREITKRCDDSVIRNVYIFQNNLNGNTKKSDCTFSRIIMRRSRGYVPTPVFLNEDIPQSLSLGAELKNTICITKGNRAFLSQHIGDLENIETLDYFENTINHMKNILQIEPEVIAYDLHPEYLNTKWLLEKELSSEKEIIGVQHHHAHIVSCMAENKISEKVIGFAMDGTGYGLDKNIWGGEIMISDLISFERYSHFEYIPMPGGDLAIKEPWRMGVSFLFHSFGEQFIERKIPFLLNLGQDKIITITQMIKKNINTFLTSSLGRLFDSLTAIVNQKNFVSYEGQAAVEFENLIYNSKQNYNNNSWYKFILDDNKSIQTGMLAEEILYDIQKGIAPEIISYKFHLGIVKILTLIAEKIRDEQKLSKVVLSGGCFQNNFLVSCLVQELKLKNFDVFTHRFVPPNDGGISLGQAVIAGMKMKFKNSN